MKIEYRVHNVSQGPIARTKAMVGKQELSVICDCVEAELVSEDGRSGTVTIRAIGDDRGAAADLFVKDAKITMTLERSAAK